MAPLVASLEERCAGEGSGVFLQDAMDTYVQARLSVLTPMFHDFIAPHLAGGVESKELVNIVAHGTTYLLAMAADEMDLFHHFWQGSGQKVGSPKQIIDAVALVLYDAFRSTVLQEEDMTALCNIIHTLNNAVLARLLASGDAGKLLAPTLSHMCQDAQERLIFRASMRIKDRIAPFAASQQECLAYTQPFGAAAAAAAASAPDGALAPRPEAAQPQYFPVLTDSLQLLSAVYNLVDKGVFSVLAQETIKACMANLMSAAQSIKAAPRATLPTAELDSRLFLVRHLLQLREQISPFEVNFQVTEKRVDLTNIRHNEISVAATQHDTKKELEGQLEQGCKQYITVASHYAGAAIVRFSKLLQERAKDPLGSTEPLGTLVELVSNIVPRSSGGGGAGADLPLRPGASSGALSEASQEEASQQQPQQEGQASGDVDADAMLPEPSQDADTVVVPQNPNAERGMKKLKQCTEEWRLVARRFEEAMPALLLKMRFYLTNQFTMGILFKPVKGNLVEAYADMHRSLTAYVAAVSEAAGLSDTAAEEFFAEVWTPNYVVSWIKNFEPSNTGTSSGAPRQQAGAPVQPSVPAPPPAPAATPAPAQQPAPAPAAQAQPPLQTPSPPQAAPPSS
eukprot:Rhum_TRINITY_DN15185_c8_g2::Rhum_TRINITY_DN15185_c8_g2_i1::g.142890::m.142890/K20290/COG3, SEC34; conserved oligomeric Golgi complex subunit 3